MTMVGFQQQMRIMHWQTKKYARHMAYGSIYDTLGDLIDTFTETCMGKYGRVELSGELGTISLQNMSDLSVNDYISKDSDVLNIRDEIMGECNKLRYLLTLD